MDKFDLYVLIKSFQLKKVIENYCIVQSQTITFQKKKIIYFNDIPSKMMKSIFYFIFKAIFVLLIFKFLS